MNVVVHQLEGVSTIPALPLAAGLLVASARKDPAIAAAASLSIHTARLDPDAVAGSHHQPDVLAFSAYAWNERLSLEVARRARARWPGAFVLFGGPSVPRRPDRAARFLREHPYVDALAFGEGELLFREVLRALLDGRPLDGVAGLALRATARPEGAMLTAPRTRMADFAETASPYLDGAFDSLVTADAPPPAAIVETNPGCPFACTFCDWGQAVQSQVRELPLARLQCELEWIARRQIPYLYIVDANYGMRRRDLDIVREIGRLRAAVGCPRYVFETRRVPNHPAPPPAVAEVEDVVVATRSLPVADWRRAFALGYLLTAAHSLRLLDVVLQVAWRAAGVPVRRLVESLLARMTDASPASAFARIRAVLERNADAVLAGEAMALPLAETGDHLWAVEDAVVVTALGAGEAFFDEVRALVREDFRDADTALLQDAVRYQRLVTPTFGCGAPRRDVLVHDIVAWRLLTPAEDGPAVPRRRTRVAFRPAPALAAAGDLRAFVTAYLAAVRARTPTGRLIAARRRARVAQGLAT